MNDHDIQFNFHSLENETQIVLDNLFETAVLTVQSDKQHGLIICHRA